MDPKAQHCHQEPPRVSPFWVKGVGTPRVDATTLDLSPAAFRRRRFNSDTLTLRKGRRDLPCHRRWIHRERAPGRGLRGHRPLAATCHFGSPPKGTTAKPLDGGALTLGWTRAQARGLAGVAAVQCHRVSPHPLIAATRSRVFSAKRRNEMRARVWSGAVGHRFVLLILADSYWMMINGSRQSSSL
jgi:hypothetical protein